MTARGFGTQASPRIKAAQTTGTGLEEGLAFDRYQNVSALLVSRDRERNVQGQPSGLVAAEV